MCFRKKNKRTKHISNYFTYNTLFFLAIFTSTYAKVATFLVEVTVQPLVLVTFVLVVTQISLLARTHIATFTAVPDNVHTGLALDLAIGALARVVALS